MRFPVSWIKHSVAVMISLSTVLTSATDVSTYRSITQMQGKQSPRIRALSYVGVIVIMGSCKCAMPRDKNCVNFCSVVLLRLLLYEWLKIG